MFQGRTSSNLGELDDDGREELHRNGTNEKGIIQHRLPVGPWSLEHRPNTAIIDDFIKANIVDAPLPDKVPPPDPARSADDLPLALATLLHSESVESDFTVFSDIEDWWICVRWLYDLLCNCC